MERRGSGSAGYVIVLLGVIAFVVGCFFPFWELQSGMRPLNYNVSYYGLVIPEGAG